MSRSTGNPKGLLSLDPTPKNNETQKGKPKKTFVSQENIYSLLKQKGSQAHLESTPPGATPSVDMVASSTVDFTVPLNPKSKTDVLMDQMTKQLSKSKYDDGVGYLTDAMRGSQLPEYFSSDEEADKPEDKIPKGLLADADHHGEPIADAVPLYPLAYSPEGAGVFNSEESMQSSDSSEDHHHMTTRSRAAAQTHLSKRKEITPLITRRTPQSDQRGEKKQKAEAEHALQHKMERLHELQDGLPEGSHAEVPHHEHAVPIGTVQPEGSFLPPSLQPKGKERLSK